MDLSGIWVFTQQWNQVRPYRFTAEFHDGIIKVGGRYYGTWKVLGNSNYLAISLTANDGSSTVAYIGNVVGSAMGGQMTGVVKNTSKVFEGSWSALRKSHYEAEMKELAAPGE